MPYGYSLRRRSIYRRRYGLSSVRRYLRGYSRRSSYYRRPAISYYRRKAMSARRCTSYLSRRRRYKITTEKTNPAVQIITPKAGYIMAMKFDANGKATKRFLRVDQLEKAKQSYQRIVGPDGTVLYG